MTFGPDEVSLHEGMRATDMNYQQLWLNYVGVSGSAGPREVEAYVLGLLTPDAYEHDLIAQAVNEWYIDRGQNHPVGYWHHTELA
jgi:hypothetical protein